MNEKRPERKERQERFTYAHRSLASESRPSRNEDAYIINEELQLIGVFDGVGGHSAGADASRAAAHAVEQEVRQWEQLDDDEIENIVPASLGDVLTAAGRKVVSRGHELYRKLTDDQKKKWESPQTTATIAKLHQFADGRIGVYIAHIGDSRAYICRADGRVERLTVDDDIMADHDELDLIDAMFHRRLTESEIERYRAEVEAAEGAEAMSDEIGVYLFQRRHHIRGSLGDGRSSAQTRVAVAEPGDIVFLTSDGVHDNLSPRRIQDIARRAHNVDELADHLTQEAYAYGHLKGTPSAPRAKRDDITVVAVKIQ